MPRPPRPRPATGRRAPAAPAPRGLTTASGAPGGTPPAARHAPAAQPALGPTKGHTPALNPAARLAAALLGALAALGPGPALGAGDRPSPPAGPPLVGEPREALRARREAAGRLDRLAQRGRRDTHDLALDADLVAEPEASGEEPDGPALAALDGDLDSAWEGPSGPGPWWLALPFARPVHLGLVRVVFGDTATEGVPASYRWEARLPRGGRCEPDAPWQPLPGGAHDDRDPNVFVHGPPDVHAQRQAAFFDVEACALRLYVKAVSGSEGPVVREVRLLESAPSLGARPGARADEWPERAPGPRAHPPGDAVDGRYESFWEGEAGRGPWQLTLTLPRAELVDRIALTLGLDAITTPRDPGPGRAYGGGLLPASYVVETSPDGERWQPVDEARLPEGPFGPLPLRRRLVRLAAPRPVRALRLRIDRATGPWGEAAPALARPVVRELAAFAADDPRPALREPLFLSVDANPSPLTARRPGGEAYADGAMARDLYHRLRRLVVDFDSDTRWPADASRPRTDAAGRFLEAIEADDPQLGEAFLRGLDPPPLVVLSGAYDWEFDETTAASPLKPGHFRWNVLADGLGPGRGMGRLAPAVVARSAPFLGFCGGAQALALFEAAARSPGAEGYNLLDRVLLRNDNGPVRGIITRKEPYERAWWYDKPALDELRPSIAFAPAAPLDSLGFRGRRESRELPSSHGDMIRASAFGRGPLARLSLVAWSHFCRPWVRPDGPEPTWPDPRAPERRCVLVPQAFASNDEGYPVVGLQFHPEQRDFKRLAPGSPPDARGDPLNVIANAVDLALESLVRLYWPGA